ncbi:very-long-chain (3R)-3-hydroxyacyl-CoA dehydratase PASTICCINO 2 [Selaginella moellendorffii]|uniref:very-long-chain (3R)-3-hydroxyacyl-CoA dehydratase PASTICCINO 2 n=1 Tax=Selaginella moellendorffii TaxID=88036 RepID=UPI000D1C9004|nr:very-long-chain (3R)-3-hydroxyacyl-CoA dehydratase PASTICCINO 2 [Selaginella moellendorffii]|eukprot:XP_024515196.1 very-long-chain (3R)-3-hydroxyacyl-CoA dehydratase PASTICCINO 2 [Selaginella moellendorffii]
MLSRKFREKSIAIASTRRLVFKMPKTKGKTTMAMRKSRAAAKPWAVCPCSCRGEGEVASCRELRINRYGWCRVCPARKLIRKREAPDLGFLSENGHLREASRAKALAMADAWSIRRVYLALYNCILCAGWASVLVRALAALNGAGYSAVYDSIELPLQLSQTAAILEIINSLAGIVRSPVSATLPQISSRLFVTWGVLWSFPETRSHWLVTLLVLSWSVTEVIRYSFFAAKEAFGLTPGFLHWLRYSTFFVLYPTGISGEVGLTMLALSHMKSSKKYSIEMPNAFNFAFSYYYTSLLVLLLYVPGVPFLYTYMIGQRKKSLARTSKKVA